jgi:hypothetical protein
MKMVDPFKMEVARMPSRPRDLADRISSTKSPEIFILSLDEARTKARDIISRGSSARVVPVVENWRQLSDGRIEFTVRNLRFSE